MIMFKNKNIQNFYDYVIYIAKKNNINVYLVNKKRIKIDGAYVNGVFYTSKTEKYLSVAINKPLKEWLPTFVHEFSHLMQYISKSSYWTNLEYNDLNACDVLYDYINGIDLYDKNTTKYCFNIIQDLEYDCEMRSIQLIKIFNLPINIDEYIQKANAYILFYNYSFKNRFWYNKKDAPYEIDYIVNNMPTKLIKGYTKLSSNLYKLYENSYKLI